MTQKKTYNIFHKSPLYVSTGRWLTHAAKGRANCSEISYQKNHKCCVVHTEFAAGLLEYRLIIL
jgi:hypothetical protein